MGRPREHGPKTRERILIAADRLLAEQGTEALSMRRIADEVGTTTRAVYSLFGGKDGLLNALYTQLADTLLKLHNGIEPSADPVSELLPLSLAYRNSALRHPNLYQLMFGINTPGFVPDAREVARARQSFGRVLDSITRAIQAGHFSGRDAELIGSSLWALVHGLASLELKGAFGPPEKAEALWRAAVHGLIAGYNQPVPVAPASQRTTDNRARGKTRR
jgi:AcrR family transcriptional regulator